METASLTPGPSAEVGLLQLGLESEINHTDHGHVRRNPRVLEPVVVGGVGGSGTRIVARILLELGVYLGSDLNDSLDNLWFTLLFKRRRWFLRHHHHHRAIRRALCVFQKEMLGCGALDLRDYATVLWAAAGMSVTGHDHLKSGRGAWPWMCARRLLSRNAMPDQSGKRWGWKEPNAHMYLDHLHRFFSAFRYIHVIRHGLDMAFSANLGQLYNWGPFLGVPIPRSPELVPRAALEYWIRANRAALARARRLLGDRFMLIRFEDLCASPRAHADRLIEFLDLDSVHFDVDRISGFVRQPRSIGRYRQHDLGSFTERQLEAVRALGFRIELPDA